MVFARGIVSDELQQHGVPAFSPDGKRLYLGSKGEGEDARFVEKQGSRWSEPKSVGILGRFPEVRHVYCPSIALSGTLYFVGYLEGQAMNLGIYRAELVNGEYARPELLPPSINSRKGARNWTPYVAPDESFLFFCSTRGLPASDQGDLFVSSAARWELVGRNQPGRTDQLGGNGALPGRVSGWQAPVLHERYARLR